MEFSLETKLTREALRTLLVSYAHQHRYRIQRVDEKTYSLQAGTLLSLNPNNYRHTVRVTLDSSTIRARLEIPRAIVPDPGMHRKRLPILKQRFQHLKEYLLACTPPHYKPQNSEANPQPQVHHGGMENTGNNFKITSCPPCLRGQKNLNFPSGFCVEKNSTNYNLHLPPPHRQSQIRNPKSEISPVCPLCASRPLPACPNKDIYSLSSFAGSITISIVMGTVAAILVMSTFGFLLIQFSPVELPEFFSCDRLGELDLGVKLLSSTFIGVLVGIFVGLLVSILLVLSESTRFVSGMTASLLVAMAVWLIVCMFVPAVWPASIACGLALPFAVYYAYSFAWMYR